MRIASAAGGALQAATFLGLSQGAAFLGKPKGKSMLALKLARKPSWLVSNEAMGPLWVAGFGLLGLSGFAAWRGGARSALPLLGAYLAGNAAVNRFGYSVEDIGLKHAAGIALIAAYARRAGERSRAARWLALPFVGWLAYVALGTRATRRRNPILSRLF